MPSNYRLKAARVLKGLTQFQLAEMIGVKEIEISRYETGRAMPKGVVRNRIAEVLKKPTFEIFEG